MKRTGQILKEARERKGVSLNEVAMATKINAKTIEALESGEISHLPQKAFIRGFVQTYAKYLGLDPHDLLNLFHEEMGQTKPDLPAAGVVRPMRQGPAPKALRGIDSVDPASASRRWMIGIAFFGLLAAIFIVVEVTRKYEKESELPDLSTIADTLNENAPLAATTSDGNIPGNTLTTEGMVTADSSTEDKGSSTTTTSTTLHSATSSTTTTSPTTTTRSTTTTTLKPTTTTTTRPTTTTTTKLTTTTRVTTTTLAPLKNGKPFEVLVEALDNVTLSFKIDGAESKSLRLAPEQAHIFSGKQNLELESSDGGAINIIVNGLDRGQPGGLGKPAKFKYP